MNIYWQIGQFLKVGKDRGKTRCGQGEAIFQLIRILHSMRLFYYPFSFGKYPVSPGSFAMLLLFFFWIGDGYALPAGIKGIPPSNHPFHLADTGKTTPWFHSFFNAHPGLDGQAALLKKSNPVQLIYTRVDRAANGNVVLQNEYYDLQTGQRFDPGMTAALPLAVCALRRMAVLGDSAGIDKSTTMITESGPAGLPAAMNDPTTADGKPSLSHYLKRMLVAGDADAYNRVFEFTGRQYLQAWLSAQGYTNVQLPARIGQQFTDLQNLYSNALGFYDDDLIIMHREPLRAVAPAKSGRLSEKNLSSLEDLHTMLVSLIFPARFTATKRFDISPADQTFLFHYMGLLPTESILPPYRDDTVTYYSCLRKLLYCGTERGGEFPPALRIFNVSDTAGGRFTDVAYFADSSAKIEFFLSATVLRSGGSHAEADPAAVFLKELGKAVYAQELKRPRRFAPDLKPYFSGYGKK